MDESQTIRVSVEEAATLLGIEKASVKKRIQRGKLRAEKDASGTVYVYLDRSETVQDQSQGQSTTGEGEAEVQREALLAAKDETIAVLRDQLEAEREARRRADTLLARFMDQLPQLEAAESHEDAAQDAAPEQGIPAYPTQPTNRTGHSEDSEQRPWWRRMFGG